MPSSLPPSRREPAVPVDRLAQCVRELDPGTRALLDLSVRRKLRDDAMAPLLQTDSFHLAWMRARALERLASGLGAGETVSLTKVRAALETLPAEVWLEVVVERPDPSPSPSPDPFAEAEPDSDPQVVEASVASTEIIPAELTDLRMPPTRLVDRLDAFAVAAPTLREAFADVGRALARKAVRLVVWRPRRRRY